MAIKTEKRLSNLENELKSLKATYTISGGAIKLYESVSPVFTSSSQLVRARIRFTPDYSSAQNMIVPSIYYEFKNENNQRYNFSNYARILPTTGDYLTIEMPALGGTFQLKIVSNIPGTFTRIQ